MMRLQLGVVDLPQGLGDGGDDSFHRARLKGAHEIADLEQIQIGFAAAGASKSVVVVPGC